MRNSFSLKLFLVAVGLALLAAAPSPALAAPGDLIPAFGTGGVVTSNPSAANDMATAMAVDASGIYIVGGDESSPDAKWRIEKRDLTTGALIAGFGTGGVVISNPSTYTDEATAIAIDASGIYAAGYDYVPGNWQWRVEKRNLTTGALIASFGTGGVVTSNPTSGLDQVSAIAIDTSGIYVVGCQNSVTSIDLWRVEKRNLTTGALIASFGTGGVVTSDPSTSFDEPYAIAVDASSIYVAGYDSFPGHPDHRWRIEKRDLTTGALVASFGTGGVVTSDPSTSSDQANAIAINASGIYVAGYANNGQWRVEKRDITTGALITGFGTGGVVTSNPTSAQGANAVAIDTSNIYIAGYDNVPSRWWEWRVEKRDLTTGALIASFGTGGVVTSDPSTSFDEPYAIAVDASNIYVAGKDYSPGNDQWRIEKRESGAVVTPPPTVNLSAAPATIILGGSSTLTWTSTDATSCAAVSPAGWTSSTATSGAQVVSPTSTTTYTLSCTGPGGTTQQSTTVTVTAPACANGDLIWGKIVDLATYVTANDIAVDNNGIYVVGDEGGGDKWRMEKRDFSGNVLWTQTFDNIPGSGSETAQDVAVDNSGLYIVGGNYLAGNSYQWRMEKRNLNDGTLTWAQTSNPSNNDTGWQVDLAYGVAVDTTGVYVVGEESLPSAGDSSWRIEKRDLNDGSLLWVKESDPDSSTNPYQQDRAMAVAVNGTGLYVVGWEITGWVVGPYVDGRWRIEKRDPASGNLIWARTSKYGAVNTMDRANNVAIDSTGIYVVGYHNPPAGGQEDWRMEKWDFNGNQIWQQTYAGAGGGQDWAQSVAVDGSGVYVGGSIALGTYSAHMRKLSLTDGSLLWSVTTSVSAPQDPGEMTTANGLAVDCRGVYWAGNYNSGVDLTWTVALREAGGSCGCGAGGGGTPPPTVTLNAAPATITSGQSSTLTWTSTDAASCAAVSPAGWTAKTTVNDSELVTNITATTTYILECTGPGGTSQQSTTVTVSGGGGGGCGLQAYDGTATIDLSCEDPPVSPLRVQKGAATYGIQLVPENDPNASRIRVAVPDGGGGTVIKALRRQ